MSTVWPKARLGDIVTDLTESRAFDVRPDDIVVDPTIASATHKISVAAASRGFQVKIRRRIRIEPGDLVISRLHTQNGAFAFSESTYHSTGTFIPLRVNEEQVTREFLYWALHRFVPSLSASDTVGRETYKTSDILRLEIVLPPIAEQRRLVDRLNALVSQIREARQLAERVDQEAAALYVSVLSTTFESACWPSRLLPEVAEVARGKFGHRPRSDPRFYGGDIPFIQIGDISHANRTICTYSQTLNQQGLAISRLFPAGTVVIAITGATIGVTGILGFDSCFPDSIVGIQAKKELVTPEFIYLAVEHAKRSAIAEATQTTQPNINLGNLNRLTVRVPPIAVQREVVATLNRWHQTVDALRRMQEEVLLEIGALMSSVVAKAFCGEL